MKWILPLALLLSSLPFALHAIKNSGDLPGLPADEPMITGDSDVYEHAWHFWWVGSALSRGIDPRFCPLIGEPPGASVLAKNIGWPDAAIWGLVSGNEAADALWFALLSGTILALLGGWAFARSWGLGQGPSALAAFIFAWAPARTAHMLQHYQIACVGLVALALATLKHFLDEGRIRSAVFFALFTLLAGLESPYHLLFIGSGSLAVAVLAKRSGTRRLLAAGTVLGAAAACAALFFLTAPGGMPDVALNWRESIFYSAEPQSFLLPSPFGLFGFLAGIPLRYSWMPNVFEGVVTTGSVVTILAVLSLRHTPFRAMIAVAAAFCLLALGPELRILGRPLGIPLPFRLLQIGPLLSWVRSPSRFAMLASLFISVPAAWMLFKLGRKSGFLAGAALILELYAPLIPSVSGRIPAFYTRPFSEQVTILEVPASPRILRYSLFQTADGMPRPVYFVPRGDLSLPPGTDPFSIDSRSPVDSGLALRSGADLIVYNRWMLDPVQRAHFDSLYSPLFQGHLHDSVAVWAAR